MRYPHLGQKTFVSDLLAPGITQRGPEDRCFVRVGTDPNEAVLSLVVDIDRTLVEHDYRFIPPYAIPPGLRPSATTDAIASVAGGTTWLRIETSGHVRIMNGRPGFSETSWGWLIGTIRYERGTA